MNIWDIVIIAAVAAGMLFAVRHVRKARKTGGCAGGCGCCSKPCGNGRDRE